MGFDFKNFFAKKSEYSILFQVTEDFIEVAAVKRGTGDDMLDMHGDLAKCSTELLYTERLPRLKPPKKNFDDLAEKVAKLANNTVTSREVVNSDFVIGRAHVACIFVEPLSVQARVTRSKQLSVKTEEKAAEQMRITERVLQDVLQKGEITLDELSKAPADLVVYGEMIESVRLNGYATNRPLDKEASRVDITVLKLLTKPALWSAVGGVIEKTFNREVTYMHKSGEVVLHGEDICDEIYTVDGLQALSNDIL